MKKSGRLKLKKLKFRKVKTWQLLVILVPLLFIDATLLRMDHLKMVDLRSAVLQADEAGDDTALAENLAALQDFVLHNIVINVVDENGEQKVMFGTGPFYLEHSYIRAANQALDETEERLAEGSSPYGNIYQAASNVCQPQAIANGWSPTTPDYINCMMGELQKYPAAEDLNQVIAENLPSTELYRMNFASPVWAPTFTGVMILITLVLVVVIFIRAVIWVVLRNSLLFI